MEVVNTIDIKQKLQKISTININICQIRKKEQLLAT